MIYFGGVSPNTLNKFGLKWLHIKEALGPLWEFSRYTEMTSWFKIRETVLIVLYKHSSF